MMNKIIDWIKDKFDICKLHWKEIFALSFALHFVFDIFIFYFGFLLGAIAYD